MPENIISVVDARGLMPLFGPRDQHLNQVRETLGVNISARNDRIRIEGAEEAVGHATDVLERLSGLVSRQGSLSSEEVSQILASVTGGEPSLQPTTIELPGAARRVRPRTAGQRRYVEAIEKNDLVFCIGPAGTGKTYLAVAMAVAAMRQERIRKIVLVRPAVEAGESLGFLPGDLYAKINPYLRPLLDALREMLDFDQVRRFMDQDLIEVIPLAYMRGRTLNDAFIILDEAQNTTVSQMKMFLTRMGMNSKIVVSGDTTQVDLPHNTRNGLIDAVERLHAIDGYKLVQLTGADIVRHRLVQDIVRAYDEGPKRRK